MKFRKLLPLLFAVLALPALASTASTLEEAQTAVRTARASGKVGTVAVPLPGGGYEVAEVPARFVGEFSEVMPSGDVLTARQIDRALAKASRRALRERKKISVDTNLDAGALTLALRADPLDADVALPSDKSVSVMIHNYGQRYSGSTIGAVSGQLWADDSTLVRMGGASAIEQLSNSDAEHGRYLSGFVDVTRETISGDLNASITAAKYKPGGDSLAPFNITGDQTILDLNYRHWLDNVTPGLAVKGGVQWVENRQEIGLVQWDTVQRFPVINLGGEFHSQRLDASATLRQVAGGSQHKNPVGLLGQFNNHAAALVVDVQHRTALDHQTAGIMTFAGQLADKALPSSMYFTTGGPGRGRAQYAGSGAAPSGFAVDLQIARALPHGLEVYSGADYAKRFPSVGKSLENGSVYTGLRGQVRGGVQFDLTVAMATANSDRNSPSGKVSFMLSKQF